jgi:pimeloyl-ACP methyl ester carboxylesterase
VQTESAPPIVLLVHGAWHGSWCWVPLAAELAALGWETRVVDLPTVVRPGVTDLYDDARAVRAEIDRVGGPVTVLGHSYGGVPATEGAAGARNVSRLIYLSAYQLDAGESVASITQTPPPPPSITTMPAPEELLKTLYTGVAEEQSSDAIARLRPQSVRSFTDQVRTAAWKTIPSTYIVCDQDEVVPPGFQQIMAARAQQVLRLSSGHSPFLSQPAELARMIDLTRE